MVVLYYQAGKSGTYGGIRTLQRHGEVPMKEANEWLASQDAYTIHKPDRRKFQRRKKLFQRYW